MNKQEFLINLQNSLKGLPKADVDERMAFYSEMIDDLMEDGHTEHEAICEIGDVEKIITQIISDIPLKNLVKEKIKPKRALRIWEIILLALGSPIWLSLLIAALAVVFSIYISLWSVIISLWAVEVSLLATVLGGIVASVVFAFSGYSLTGVAMIGTVFCLTGLSILFFYVCKLTTKGILLLTKQIAIKFKNCFIKKEVNL